MKLVPRAARNQYEQIIARLLREGWVDSGGTKHAKFRKGGQPAIMVPRHRQVTSGVAASIARAAGWSKQD